MTGAQKLWDRWHFLRYRDPDPHLRLRFHGVPCRLLAELLPLIHTDLEERRAQGLLWTWQVATFEPEWERYGGALGFSLAEAWFWADSQRVLEHLAAGMTPEQRWRTGLQEVDAIWAALGLGLPERKVLAQAAREGFRKEFGDTGAASAQLGVTFRGLRRGLEAGFPVLTGASGARHLRDLARIREASDQGLLEESLTRIAGSLAHMHLNRLFRNHPREHEWVLMEFLTRLYDSHLARFPESPATGSGG
jgi:thiopeptide-type bacteriocin biosynthesis protein